MGERGCIRGSVFGVVLRYAALPCFSFHIRPALDHYYIGDLPPASNKKETSLSLSTLQKEGILRLITIIIPAFTIGLIRFY